jgi:D-amino-acid oxidase
MTLTSLPPRGVVVNCSGLAAHALVPDPGMRPIRGQVVHARDPGLDAWWADEEEIDGEMTYVLPHGRHVVVGGTAQEGSWSTAPDPATAERILARARAMVPALAAAEVLGHRVGLRPARAAVRLDVEHRNGGARVHCYGHGGSGVTLSWGCAADVLAAVARLDAKILR